jgi:hypothetical protein
MINKAANLKKSRKINLLLMTIITSLKINKERLMIQVFQFIEDNVLEFENHL